MIGIVTPYKIPNYGTKLQAYAMQELMGDYDDAEILGFVPSTDKRLGSVLGKLYLKGKNILKKKAKVSDLEKRRTEAINSFDKYYRFGKIVRGNAALRTILPEYDAIVCGSDQLWAPTNVIADYFTLTLIPKRMNKFSFAASFGVRYVPSYLRPKYRHFLNELSHISVRETQGITLVKELSGKEATMVLDPTLMIASLKWKDIAKKSKLRISEPFVFCYFLGSKKFQGI